MWHAELNMKQCSGGHQSCHLPVTSNPMLRVWFSLAVCLFFQTLYYSVVQARLELTYLVARVDFKLTAILLPQPPTYPKCLSVCLCVVCMWLYVFAHTCMDVWRHFLQSFSNWYFKIGSFSELRAWQCVWLAGRVLQTSMHPSMASPPLELQTCTTVPHFMWVLQIQT